MDVVNTIVSNNPHLNWIQNGLLYLILHGSKSYNCHREDGSSDDDFKGITLVPKQYLFGLRTKFEQVELKKPNPDTVIYSIKKFFTLCANNNPNCLEMLYVNPEHQLFIHPLMNKILKHRDKFLSTKVRHSYAGFAWDQMRRVRLHRSWLLHEKNMMPPTRDQFGLPPEPEIGNENLKAAMAAVNKELEKYNFNFMTELDPDQKIEIRNYIHQMLLDMEISHNDRFTAMAKKIGMDDNLIFILQKEREYNSKLEDWKKFLDWKKNRNPERAADEAKFGYDTKFGYHIYRLLVTCKEILLQGKINVFREDRDEILKIRRGERSFEWLEEFTLSMDKELEEIYNKTTILPRTPDYQFLENLYQEIVMEGLGCF